MIADDKEQAYKLASAKFKKEYGNRKYHPYPEFAWTNLEINLLCNNVSKPFISEIYE